MLGALCWGWSSSGWVSSSVTGARRVRNSGEKGKMGCDWDPLFREACASRYSSFLLTLKGRRLGWWWAEMERPREALESDFTGWKVALSQRWQVGFILGLPSSDSSIHLGRFYFRAVKALWVERMGREERYFKLSCLSHFPLGWVRHLLFVSWDLLWDLVGLHQQVLILLCFTGGYGDR